MKTTEERVGLTADKIYYLPVVYMKKRQILKRFFLNISYSSCKKNEWP